jgi:hypothetical protein
MHQKTELVVINSIDQNHESMSPIARQLFKICYQDGVLANQKRKEEVLSYRPS